MKRIWPIGVWNLKCLLLTMSLLGSLFFARAQDQVSFRQLGKKDGLSQGSVFSIAQDSAGYMWFGTRNGLNKYDGYNFKVYKKQDNNPQSLVDNDIRTLYVDPICGKLWIGTLNGLSRYDQASETFTNFTEENGLASISIRVVFRDSHKRLWVGTATGLHLYNDTNERFEKITFQDQGRVNVITLLEDSQHNLWLGTREGLYLLSESADGKFSMSLANHPKVNEPLIKQWTIQSLLEDQDGSIWIGTQDHGLFKWDTQNQQLQNYEYELNNEGSLSNNNVRSMALAPDGSIWIGTFVGLNHFLPKRNTFKRYISSAVDPNSLSHSSIRPVYFDRNGGLWVGTYHGGISYFDPSLSRFKNFEHLPNSKSISNNIVSSFIEDEKGNLWIGTEGGGLNYYDRQNQDFTSYQTGQDHQNCLSGNNVKALMKDGNDLWIGTFEQGVSILDLTNNRFSNIRAESDHLSQTINNNNVYGFFKEGDYVWIVTYGGGLNIYNTKTKAFSYFTAKSDSTTISSNLNRVIFQDRKQRIWIGTENGLNLVMRDSVGDLNLHFKRLLEGVKVYDIFEDQQGKLWIGSFSDGLIALDTDDFSYKVYTEENGLPGESIFGIIQDKHSNVWLSTNNGISKFNINTETFTNYNFSNGLKNLEFNFNAHAITRKGEILFGGTKGFTLFDPDEIIPNLSFPPLVFTDLKVFNNTVDITEENPFLNKTLNETESLTFKYNEAIFSIGFAALDYLNPSYNQYVYRLEGLEDNEIYATGKSEASYTIQKPGTYLFTLKGANSDGIWNPEERKLKITVLSPPWLSPWAYIIYGILIVGAVLGGLYFIRLRQDLQMEQLAKKQQKELNEMKLRFFTNITHEFRTPLTLIIGPLEEIMKKYQDNGVNRSLQSVHRNIQRLLSLVNQILTFRKLETDHEQMQAMQGNIVDFLNQIFLSFEENARIRNIQYLFQASESEITVWFDYDKMEKVIFNLLSNAFKFTPDGGRIKLMVSRHGDQVQIAVIDSGNGISKELHHQIFKRFYEKVGVSINTIKGSGIGLALSKQLIELHRGKIWVESELGNGAAFFVHLPLGKNHLKTHELVSSPVIPVSNQPKRVELPLETTFKDFEVEKTIAPVDPHLPLLLIVEDNKEILNYIKTIFESSYRIETAFNGKEGWTKARQLNPDLVISDVMMPIMDGKQLCDRLKRDIKTSHTPVILLTAKAGQLFKNEGLEIGADDYVTKPFNPEELKLRVRNLITNRNLMRKKFVRVMNLEPKEITVTSADEEFLTRALMVAEKQIANPNFTAEQFAYELAVSRPLLFTKIKALTSQTPNNFMKTLRLKRAAQLLEQKKLNVSEVAARVGFKDTRYFSKCFQKQFNKTPSEFMSSY